MKKILLFVCFFFSLLSITKAQSPDSTQNNSILRNTHIDFIYGFSNTQNMAAVSINKFFGLFAKKKFEIGFGLRGTLVNTKEKSEFYSAPADLYAYPDKRDTLFSMEKSNILAINLNLQLRYKVSKKLGVGFNIDVIGFTEGRKQEVGMNTMLIKDEASPTSPNILLGGDADKGTLNSEFYAFFYPVPKLMLRAGYSYVFTEYTTPNAYKADNKRFRHKEGLIMLGIAYKIR